MTFDFEPIVLSISILLVPVVFLLYWRCFKAQHRDIQAYFGPGVLETYLLSVDRRWTKAIAVTSAFFMLAIAVSQPEWGSQKEDVPRRGRDIVVLLDVSTSMLAQDMIPNRLSVAKQAIVPLVEELREEGGHRLGLVTFAGRANLQCPLTHDYDFFLRKLEESSIDSAARKGTQIGDALRQVVEGFGGVEASYTDIILLTDGEDHDSFPREAAQIAAGAGATLHAFGLGDPVDGAVVPDPDKVGQDLFYRGEIVVSRMDPELLREIALIGGGKAIPVGLGEFDLRTFYGSEIASKDRRIIDATSTERPIQYFQWFVLLAVLLLSLEMVLGDRRQPVEKLE